VKKLCVQVACCLILTGCVDNDFATSDYQNPTLAKIPSQNDVTSSTLSVSNITVDEGNEAYLKVSLSRSLFRGSSQAASVSYSTQQDTAQEGEDFTKTSGQLTFSANETEKYILVKTMTGGTYRPNDKKLYVAFSKPSNLKLSDSRATVSISNQIAPVITIDKDQLSVDAGAEVELIATLSRPSAIAVTAKCLITDISESTEIVIEDAVMRFEPGESNKKIKIPTKIDNTNQLKKNLRIELSKPQQATLSDSVIANVTVKRPQQIAPMLTPVRNSQKIEQKSTPEIVLPAIPVWLNKPIEAANPQPANRGEKAAKKEDTSDKGEGIKSSDGNKQKDVQGSVANPSDKEAAPTQRNKTPPPDASETTGKNGDNKGQEGDAQQLEPANKGEEAAKKDDSIDKTESDKQNDSKTNNDLTSGDGDKVTGDDGAAKKEDTSDKGEGIKSADGNKQKDVHDSVANPSNKEAAPSQPQQTLVSLDKTTDEDGDDKGQEGDAQQLEPANKGEEAAKKDDSIDKTESDKQNDSKTNNDLTSGDGDKVTGDDGATKKEDTSDKGEGIKSADGNKQKDVHDSVANPSNKEAAASQPQQTLVLLDKTTDEDGDDKGQEGDAQQLEPANKGEEAAKKDDSVYKTESDKQNDSKTNNDLTSGDGDKVTGDDGATKKEDTSDKGEGIKSADGNKQKDAQDSVANPSNKKAAPSQPNKKPLSDGSETTGKNGDNKGQEGDAQQIEPANKGEEDTSDKGEGIKSADQSGLPEDEIKITVSYSNSLVNQGRKVIANVTLDQKPEPQQEVIVEYQGVDDSAIAGKDFKSTVGQLIFNADNHSKPQQIEVSTYYNVDNENQKFKTFKIEFSKAVSNTSSNETISIQNNDLPKKLDTLNFKIKEFDKIKTLSFEWEKYSDASYYRLLERLEGKSSYLPVARIDNANANSYEYTPALIALVGATYVLEACDSDNQCVWSNPFETARLINKGIGYFKASNADSGDLFGQSVSLSADGKTLAVGARQEASDQKGILSGTEIDSRDIRDSDLKNKNTGAVYIFSLGDDGWIQQAYITPENLEGGGLFWIGG
jgi:hypothetical protein